MLCFFIHNLVVFRIVHGIRGKGGGFLSKPVLFVSMLDPTNGRVALLLFDCQIFDRTIDVSGVGESHG